MRFHNFFHTKNYLFKRWISGFFSLLLAGLMVLAMAQPAFATRGEAEADDGAAFVHRVLEELQVELLPVDSGADAAEGTLPDFADAAELADAMRDEANPAWNALWYEADVEPAAGDLVLFADPAAESEDFDAQNAARIGIVSEVTAEETDVDGAVIAPAQICVFECYVADQAEADDLTVVDAELLTERLEAVEADSTVGKMFAAVARVIDEYENTDATDANADASDEMVVVERTCEITEENSEILGYVNLQELIAADMSEDDETDDPGTPALPSAGLGGFSGGTKSSADDAPEDQKSSAAAEDAANEKGSELADGLKKLSRMLNVKKEAANAANEVVTAAWGAAYVGYGISAGRMQFSYTIDGVSRTGFMEITPIGDEAYLGQLEAAVGVGADRYISNKSAFRIAYVDGNGDPIDIDAIRALEKNHSGAVSWGAYAEGAEITFVPPLSPKLASTNTAPQEWKFYGIRGANAAEVSGATIRYGGEKTRTVQGVSFSEIPEPGDYVIASIVDGPRSGNDGLAGDWTLGFFPAPLRPQSIAEHPTIRVNGEAVVDLFILSRTDDYNRALKEKGTSNITPVPLSLWGATDANGQHNYGNYELVYCANKANRSTSQMSTYDQYLMSSLAPAELARYLLTNGNAAQAQMKRARLQIALENAYPFLTEEEVRARFGNYTKDQMITAAQAAVWDIINFNYNGGGRGIVTISDQAASDLRDRLLARSDGWNDPTAPEDAPLEIVSVEAVDGNKIVATLNRVPTAGEAADLQAELQYVFYKKTGGATTEVEMAKQGTLSGKRITFTFPNDAVAANTDAHPDQVLHGAFRISGTGTETASELYYYASTGYNVAEQNKGTQQNMINCHVVTRPFHFAWENKGFGFEVLKVAAGNEMPLSGVGFQLYRDAALRDLAAARTTDHTGRLAFDGLAAGTYYLVEMTPDGYVPEFGTDNPITVTIAADGAVTFAAQRGRITADGRVVTVTNTPESEKVRIRVRKVWQGTVPASGSRVVVDIYQNGTLIKTVILDAGNQWETAVTDLPKADAAGNDYIYTAKERTYQIPYEVEYETYTDTDNHNYPVTYETDTTGATELFDVAINNGAMQEVQGTYEAQTYDYAYDMQMTGAQTASNLTYKTASFNTELANVPGLSYQLEITYNGGKYCPTLDAGGNLIYTSRYAADGSDPTLTEKKLLRQFWTVEASGTDGRVYLRNAAMPNTYLQKVRSSIGVGAKNADTFGMNREGHANTLTVYVPNGAATAYFFVSDRRSTQGGTTGLGGLTNGDIGGNAAHVAFYRLEWVRDKVNSTTAGKPTAGIPSHEICTGDVLNLTVRDRTDGAIGTPAYRVTSGAPEIATARIQGEKVVITGMAAGSAPMTLEVSAGGSWKQIAAFTVYVKDPATEKHYEQEIRITNTGEEPPTEVRIKKTDEDGKLLPGAKFKLYNMDGEQIGEEMEGGEVLFTGLDAGTYYFEETQAPDGYERFVGKIYFTLTRKSDGSWSKVFDGAIPEVSIDPATGQLLIGGKRLYLNWVDGQSLNAKEIVLTETPYPVIVTDANGDPASELVEGNDYKLRVRDTRYYIRNYNAGKNPVWAQDPATETTHEMFDWKYVRTSYQTMALQSQNKNNPGYLFVDGTSLCASTEDAQMMQFDKRLEYYHMWPIHANGSGDSFSIELANRMTQIRILKTKAVGFDAKEQFAFRMRVSEQGESRMEGDTAGDSQVFFYTIAGGSKQPFTFTRSGDVWEYIFTDGITRGQILTVYGLPENAVVTAEEVIPDGNGWKPANDAWTVVMDGGKDVKHTPGGDNAITFENYVTGKFVLEKVDEDGRPIGRLAEDDARTAEFVLVDGSYSDGAAAKAAAADQANHRYTSAPEGSENRYKFSDVRIGTYWLVETKAPAGYFLGEPVKVQISINSAGLVDVTYLGGAPGTIRPVPGSSVAPGADPGDTAVVSGLGKDNVQLGSGGTSTAYCLNAWNRMPGGTDYEMQSYGSYGTLSDVVGRPGTTAADENALREKLITLLYFGQNGAGNQALDQAFDTYVDRLENVAGRESMKLAYENASQADKDLYWYWITQTLIWSEISGSGWMTPEGNSASAELARRIPDYNGGSNYLFQGIRAVLNSMTYADVLEQTDSKVLTLHVLIPQGEAADREQKMIIIEGLEGSEIHFQYLDKEIYELPSAGGLGTYWNTIIGTMFLCMAGAVLLRYLKCV